MVLTSRYSIAEEKLHMKVSQLVENLIQSRPYKYTYKQTLIRDVKKLGIWEMEVEDVTSAYIRDVVDAVRNHNSRRRLYITARSIFKSLDKCQDLPVLQSISRIYQFPEQEHLDFLINKSKYRLQLFLCMYGGLRLGEACAVTPSKLEGNYLRVDEAYSQDGLHLGSPKTVGRVLLPEWLADEVRAMKPEQYWKKGTTTKKVSSSIYKISRFKGAEHLTGGKPINPHMLRHWYATDMIKRGISPEVVRRQMRHARIETTMRVYVQVHSKDLEASVPTKFIPSESTTGNVIPFRLTTA
jgi:integrase